MEEPVRSLTAVDESALFAPFGKGFGLGSVAMKGGIQAVAEVRHRRTIRAPGRVRAVPSTLTNSANPATKALTSRHLLARTHHLEGTWVGIGCLAQSASLVSLRSRMRLRNRSVCMWPYGFPTSVPRTVVEKVLYSQANIAPPNAPSATPYSVPMITPPKPVP